MVFAKGRKIASLLDKYKKDDKITEQTALMEPSVASRKKREGTVKALGGDRLRMPLQSGLRERDGPSPL